MSLLLVRHGQSVYNQENRFTGFLDVPLSEQGIQEAQAAGRELTAYGADVVFTSVLERAKETARIMMEVAHLEAPVYADKALNERGYGQLEGLNKDEVRQQYGAQQVQIWRRSYEVAPPGGESLKETCDRVGAYYEKAIQPYAEAGKQVLVVAHGNSLRALIMKLLELSEDEVVSLEVPTGKLLVYDFYFGKWQLRK